MDELENINEITEDKPKRGRKKKEENEIVETANNEVKEDSCIENYGCSIDFKYKIDQEVYYVKYINTSKADNFNRVISIWKFDVFFGCVSELAYNGTRKYRINNEYVFECDVFDNIKEAEIRCEELNNG
jgi:hypothetical protein